LKLPLESKQLKVTFHVEHKPGGGFVIHSSDPGATPIEGATHEEVESKFAEKLIGFMGKHFVPELAEAFAAQALAGQGNLGEIKVFVSKNSSVSVNTGLPKLDTAAPQGLSSIVLTQPGDAEEKGLKFGSKVDANPSNAIEAVANVPIIPESSSSRTFFRLLFALLIIGTLAYLFFHYSH
jgi:hypothetical protein